MILSKKDLEDYLKTEKKLYIPSIRYGIYSIITLNQRYYLWKLMKSLRYLEFHKNNRHKIRTVLWLRRKNKLASKLGIYIEPNCVGKGLMIWHPYGVVIHEKAIIGENCQLHGMNCIGNKGIPNSGIPHIGNNVNIGVGAKIIGDINVADNVSIGANAVVTHSCEGGEVLVGIPAHAVLPR